MAVLFDNNPVGDPGTVGLSVTVYRGQSITPVQSYTAVLIRCSIHRTGANPPGIITAELRTNDGGSPLLPSGNILASGTFDGDTLPPAGPLELQNFTLTPTPILTAGVTYFIAMHAGSALQRSGWQIDGVGLYPRGYGEFSSSDGGIIWLDGDPNDDQVFEVYGNAFGGGGIQGGTFGPLGVSPNPCVVT